MRSFCSSVLWTACESRKALKFTKQQFSLKCSTGHVMLKHQKILIACVLAWYSCRSLEHHVLYEPTGATRGKNSSFNNIHLSSQQIIHSGLPLLPILQADRPTRALAATERLRCRLWCCAHGDGSNREHTRTHAMNEIRLSCKRKEISFQQRA